MSKSKKRIKSQKNSTSNLKRSEDGIPKKGICYLWKIFTGFAVILGVIVALYPKISIEPDSYLDPKNPLKTLFRVTNEGFLPLRNVKIYSSIQQVRSNGELRISGVSNYGSRFFNPTHVANKISYGESDTAFCPLGALKIPFSVDYADMAIIVEFSPHIFTFWRMERTFPFTTQKTISGDVILIHRPLTK